MFCRFRSESSILENVKPVAMTSQDVIRASRTPLRKFFSHHHHQRNRINRKIWCFLVCYFQKIRKIIFCPAAQYRRRMKLMLRKSNSLLGKQNQEKIIHHPPAGKEVRCKVWRWTAKASIESWVWHGHTPRAQRTGTEHTEKKNEIMMKMTVVMMIIIIVITIAQIAKKLLRCWK